MNNAYKFDEYGNVLAPRPRHQKSPPPHVAQYETPRWRQERPMRNNQYPQSNMPGPYYSSPPRMAPPMDRQANRSRSPMNMQRGPQEYRSRTPPSQPDIPPRSTARPQLSYPRPMNPYREVSPARPALRSDSPPQFQRHRQSPPQSGVPYPRGDNSPPGAQFRRSPVARPGMDIPASEPSRTFRTQIHIVSQDRTRPNAGPISDVTRELLPQAEIDTRVYPTQVRPELVPRPLNFRGNNTAPRTETSSDNEEQEGEFLSLDELENLWESQDLYSGTITASTATAKSTSSTCAPAYNMAPVGPMSPSLADHPAFRTEMRQYNNYVYA